MRGETAKKLAVLYMYMLLLIFINSDLSDYCGFYLLQLPYAE